MYSKVSELSAFVLGLNAEAHDRGVSDLVTWAVAQVQQTGTVIHASTTFNLPPHYHDIWTGIDREPVVTCERADNGSDVARMPASGKTHKLAARLPGNTPSTARNHTQAIHAELNVDNRADPAATVPDVPPLTTGLDNGLTFHA